MKFRWKWVFTGLFALIAAVVVAAYAMLSTMEFEELRGTIEAEAEKATGRKLSLDGPIDLQISLTPAITMQDVKFANASWGSRPDMVSVERFELEVAILPLLSGDIQIKRLVLVGPDILLETGPKGRGNWQLAQDAEADKDDGEAGDLTLPSFDKIRLRDAVLTYRDSASATETRIEITRLDVQSAGSEMPITIEFEGAYNAAPFAGMGTLGSVNQLLGEGPFPFDLRTEAGGATAQTAGSIAKPLTGQGLVVKIQAQGQSLADLGPLSGVEMPPLGPYDVGVQVEQQGNAFKLTGLAAKLGTSDVTGAATVTLTGSRPSLDGSFVSSNLDVNDVVPPSDGEASPAPSDSGESKFIFTEEPLPLDALTLVDAKIDLKAKQVKLRGDLTVSNLDLALVLAEGNLTIKPLSLDVAGGTLAGTINLGAGQKAPPLSVNLTARQIDYGKLLKDRQITDGVTGALDAKIGLQGAGASPRTIAAGLNGRIEVTGGKGSISNDLIQGAGAGLLDMLSVWREADSDLQLNCVVLRMPIKAGVATSEAILLDTDAATVGGSGDIDLSDESLDLRITPQAKQTSLMSLAVPFLIGGTLSAPSAVPDPVGTAVGAAKIAGLFINPLAAGALIILDSDSTEANPCVTALEQPAGQPVETRSTPEAVIEDTTEGAKKVIEGVGEGITKGLKGLFGD